MLNPCGTHYLSLPCCALVLRRLTGQRPCVLLEPVEDRGGFRTVEHPLGQEDRRQLLGRITLPPGSEAAAPTNRTCRGSCRRFLHRDRQAVSPALAFLQNDRAVLA